MEYPIAICTMADYESITAMGFNPLMDWRRFQLDIGLRITLQSRLFGRVEIGHGDIPQANQRFYMYCWENSKVHVCQESQQPLYEYSATFISHILSRGAHPEMAHDPRNFNLLSKYWHDQWENGNRDVMKVRKENNRIIKLLNEDYQYI